MNNFDPNAAAAPLAAGELTADSDLITAMEKAEASAWSQFFQAATPESVETCGIKVFRVGAAVGTFAAKCDVLGFNRILGLGLGDVSAEEELKELLEAARNSGAPRFFVQLSPAVDTPEFRKLLEVRGLEYYNNWVRLRRDSSPVTGVKCDLRVERIGASLSRAFGQIVVESFGWPEGIAAMAADLIGRPNWYHYLAFAGTKPVATAAMHINGDAAWIDFAATLADYRGRGAQAALLQRRVADAASQGGKYLVVETAEQTRDRPVPSYRNMIRYGFRTVYLRPNFIWQKDKAQHD